jgi:hypothetical protein
MRPPNPRDFFANWRASRLSFPDKARVALRNTTIKMVKRRNCCGHHGEPGC